MVDHDRKELVIEGVPESQVSNAGILINQAAAHIVESEVASGERKGLELGNQMPIVTLFDVGPAVQCIADGHVESADAGPPRVALTTVALARAASELGQRNQEAAMTIMEDSIAFYPGEPLGDAEPFFGYPYNWQNCLTYEELAKHYRGEKGADYLRRACNRSVIMQSQILGAPMDMFSSMDADQVARRAAFIHRTNADTFQVEDGPNDALAITISPLWELGEEDAVHRSLVMLPEKLLALYWNETVMEAVDSDPVYGLIGEVVEAHGDDPVALAARVTDARRLWTDPSAPTRKFEAEYFNGDVLFSTVVAHVARLMSAGAQMPELRVSLGLSDDDDARTTLAQIIDKVESLESSAYNEAMQQVD
ncbi:MAG: hypothetical protein ACQEVA_11700 [Myxococcota bacterium]